MLRSDEHRPYAQNTMEYLPPLAYDPDVLAVALQWLRLPLKKVAIRSALQYGNPTHL
jgi:hypothetical protein